MSSKQTPKIRKGIAQSPPSHHFMPRDHALDQDYKNDPHGVEVDERNVIYDQGMGHNFGDIPIQAKLTVNQPDDEYEREADRVADKVMRMPEKKEEEEREPIQAKSLNEGSTTTVMRQLENEEEEDDEPVQAKLLNSPFIQRQAEAEDEEKIPVLTQQFDRNNIQLQEAESEEDEESVQTKPDPTRHRRRFRQIRNPINRLNGIGQSLPVGTRESLEHRFGHDFSNVRIYTGEQASSIANDLNARALTIGEKIVFNRGQYVPGSRRGNRLLAHELTHVIQQTGNKRSKVPRIASKPKTRQPTHQSLRIQKRLSRKEMIQRSRALFISTHGNRGFLNNAAAFHREHNYPNPQRVSSVEEMLEHMVRMRRPIQWVRIVSHATDQGIMLPLLRGGGSTLFQQDLTLQRRFEMQQELGLENITVRRRRRVGRRRVTEYVVQQVAYHSAPQNWVRRAWQHIARSTPANATLLRNIGLTQSPNPMTEMHNFFWWILDRELLNTPHPRQRRGRRIRYLINMSARTRRRVMASINRNIGIFRTRVIAGPYAGGIPLDVARRAPPERGGRRTPQQVRQLEAAIVSAAQTIIQRELRTGIRARFQEPSTRYRTIQGALERGTYARNLLRAKYSIANGAELQIRGCNIGQNQTWLERFQDFFGHGTGTRRSRPHVSAPNLRMFYGRTSHRVRRGRRRVRIHGPWREWLQTGRGRRRRRIYPNNPRFRNHIVHVR
jgi:hypothetical protein